MFSCKIKISSKLSPHLQLCLIKKKILGPVAQSMVSLMSSLVVKMLTVLESAISNSQVFLLKKYECKATHIFSAKILAYMPYLMIKVLTIR